MAIAAEADGKPVMRQRTCPELDVEWLERDDSSHLSKLLKEKQVSCSRLSFTSSMMSTFQIAEFTRGCEAMQI